MNMIKVLTLSLILGLSFGLSSCNDRPRPPAQGEPAAPAPDKDKPALFSTKSPADNSELIPAYVPDAQVAMEGMAAVGARWQAQPDRPDHLYHPASLEERRPAAFIRSAWSGDAAIRCAA